MSIQSEINRISENISDSLGEVALKGVTVPAGSNSDDLPGLIRLIEQSGGSGVGGVIYQDEDGYLVLSEEAANVIGITRTLDEHGGEILDIVGVSLAEDTVTPATLASGVTAHNAAGEAIVGTAPIGGYSEDEIASRTKPSGAITITLSGALEDYALYGRRNLGSVTAQNLTQLKNSVFEWCDTMTTASFPNVTSIGTRCFANCEDLETISFPSVTSIGGNCFVSCESLLAASFPNVTSIGASCFVDCHSLKTVNIPKVTSIPNYCFNKCYALENSDFSNVTTLGNNAFYLGSVKGCTFNPITANDGAFRDATFFGQSLFPRLTTVNGTYTFAGILDASSKNSTVTALVMPSLTTISTDNAFSYNPSLIAVDFGSPGNIPKQTFRVNPVFNVLVLRKTNSITTLANIDAFTDTPFASNGSGGTLYVPSAMISSYQSATNWSVILGYANNSIVAIEGSQYEHYYADGTPIPTT